MMKVDRLETLYEILLDNMDRHIADMIYFINNPKTLANTNKFAALLRALNNPLLVEPLLNKISISNKDDLWLLDYMYVVSALLELNAVEFTAPDELIDKLAVWLLDNDGELSWKAADLLKHYDSDRAAHLQLKKLQQQDYYMVHVCCIIGLLNCDRQKYLPLVKKIAADNTRDVGLREYCDYILK